MREEMNENKIDIGPSLTWDELADLYDREDYRRHARTLPIDHVFSWASKQIDKFYVDNEGEIHLITESKRRKE